MIGLLPENVGLYENLSAYQNLDYYAKFNKISEEQRQENIDTSLRCWAFGNKGIIQQVNSLKA